MLTHVSSTPDRGSVGGVVNASLAIEVFGEAVWLLGEPQVNRVSVLAALALHDVVSP
jgi:hypothetical protein